MLCRKWVCAFFKWRVLLLEVSSVGGGGTNTKDARKLCCKTSRGYKNGRLQWHSWVNEQILRSLETKGGTKTVWCLIIWAWIIFWGRRGWEMYRNAYSTLRTRSPGVESNEISLVVDGGEWMLSPLFEIFVSLFFGLLVGLVSQSTDICMSIAFRNIYIRIFRPKKLDKDIPVLAQSIGEFEQFETTNMNWKYIHSEFSGPWVLFSCLDMKYLFYLNFFPYLSV